MGSRVVIDRQALATGCVPCKRTVPCLNVVKRIAQTIHVMYVLDARKTLWFLSLVISSIICVIEIDFYCHFNLYPISIYYFNSRGRMPLAGNSLRAKKSHWQVQKVTLAGPKSHTRAKLSHWSVIITFEACWIVWHMTSSFCMMGKR